MDSTELIKAIEKLNELLEWEMDQWMHEDVSDYGDLLDDDSDEVKALGEKIGPYECVEQHGGEGEGDSYWTVYHFKAHDIYLQFDGWYASHCGAEFNDVSEVFPTLVTKTEYVSTKPN
jgi:hypothetical protein